MVVSIKGSVLMSAACQELLVIYSISSMMLRSVQYLDYQFGPSALHES
jgi:hypothetical protein